jgi:hypothetical protein
MASTFPKATSTCEPHRSRSLALANLRAASISASQRHAIFATTSKTFVAPPASWKRIIRGISPTFRLPRSGSYPALMASAQAIIAAATPLQAAFVDAGLPGTFLTELAALLTAFQNATNQKHDGGITQVQGTAALNAKANLGVKAARDCDACVRNHFRNNPEMLAAWTHARRIEKAPVRSDAQTPAAATTASPPAPSSAASVLSTLNPQLWSPRANTTRHRSALIAGRRRSVRSGGVFCSFPARDSDPDPDPPQADRSTIRIKSGSRNGPVPERAQDERYYPPGEHPGEGIARIIKCGMRLIFSANR